MSRIYDNWERLVSATLRREQLWQLAHAPSMSSRASDFSTLSYELPNLPSDFSTNSNSWYHQNPDSKTGLSRWGYSYNEYELENKSDEIKLLVPGDIFVNGKALNGRELKILQNCLNPPKKLKPGYYYWYDKYSGFWGKQGHRASQIISANLDLGSHGIFHASNGNTEVYINGREITKVELRALQLAGVKCYRRDMHFLLNEDGTYQEEGSNSYKASIWGKPRVKLLCSLFSLPFPSNSLYTSEDPSVTDIEQRDIQKLFLTGCSGSGISTIFKQAIFLYKDIPFLEDELEYIKLLIQTDLYRYIRILLEEHHEHFQEENLDESRNSPFPNAHWLTGYDDANDEESMYTFGPRLKAFSDWLLHSMPSDSSGVFSASLVQASAPLIEELLTNPALQDTFNRINDLERLPSVANYFLKRAVDILKPDYKPSSTDILYAEGFPSSVSYTDFSFPPPHADEVAIWDLQDYMTRYKLITSTLNIFGNMYKFETKDVRLIIFSVSLTDYDQFVINVNGDSVNKMMFNKECFDKMVTNPFFDGIQFLLLLTKYDLFEEKIRRIPLNQCDWFHDFIPVLDGYDKNWVTPVMGLHYVSVKFKELYASLTGGKLYVAKVNCLDQDGVDATLKYATDILKWNEHCNDFFYDYSSDGSLYSVEDT